MNSHSWAVELILLVVIGIIGFTLGLVAHHQTSSPIIDRDTLRWCEAPRPFEYRGLRYPDGWQYPCRWQPLEQDV